MQFLCGGDDTGGENVAAQDAAKNIDEDGFDFRIAHQNAESVLDLFGGSAAANIEEIRGRAARVFDDVHGGHGEAGAVDHAGHAAIELDVVEAVLGGFDFERIFFIEVAEFAKILVAKERVVVKRHLGVERNEFAVTGEDARIDFQHGGVGVNESAMERLEERDCGIHNFARQSKAEGDFARLV